VVSVLPALRGEDLVCDVRTAGLPTDKAERAMRGGLPSGIEIAVELVDGEGEAVARRELFFRLAFDLWDESFRVEDGADRERLETIESLRTFLEAWNGLPVASLAGLAGTDRYRIRVDLVSHEIAPSEVRRIGEWIAGDASGTESDPDGREVSLGLGSLIRFFYEGSREARPERARGESAWFRVEDLEHAAHPF
jgi:hypothetical protein